MVIVDVEKGEDHRRGSSRGPTRLGGPGKRIKGLRHVALTDCLLEYTTRTSVAI